MQEQTEQTTNPEDFREIVQNIQAVYKQAINVYKLRVDDIIINKNIYTVDVKNKA